MSMSYKNTFACQEEPMEPAFLPPAGMPDEEFHAVRRLVAETALSTVFEGEEKPMVAKVAKVVANDENKKALMSKGYEVVAEVAKVAVNRLEKASTQEDLPLRTRPQDQTAYPIAQLGPFAGAVQHLSQTIKVPEAMAGSSVLTALAFCVQGLANVQMHDGRLIPLSLNCMTVGDSGDRKTALDSVVSQAISAIEREEHARYQGERKIFLQAKDEYDRRPKKEKELFPFELEPPKNPAMILENVNAEGLFRTLKEGRPSLAVFSDEGGTLFGGTAFQKENALKSITFFSKLWDGSPVDKARAGEDFARLYDRRLSMHLMLQPTIAEKILSDDMFQGQGFLPRFLMAWPKSLKGTRIYENANVRNNEHVISFYRVCEKLLRIPLRIDESSGSIMFTTLQLSKEAHEYWIKNHNNIEQQLGTEGGLHSIAAYASKSAEQAIRIAGVLTLANNPQACIIDAETMKNAVILSRWYLAEILRIRQNGVAPKDILQAEALLQWLDAKGIQKLSLRLILRKGPTALRLKKAAEEAVRLLEEHGQIRRGLGSEWIEGRDTKTFWERVVCA